MGGNVGENECKEEMKNSGQLEIRRSLFCVCVYFLTLTREPKCSVRDFGFVFLFFSDVV